MTEGERKRSREERDRRMEEARRYYNQPRFREHREWFARRFGGEQGGGPAKSRQTATKTCAELIRGELQSGPKPSTYMLKLGRKYGWARDKMQTSLEKIGGERSKVGFQGQHWWYFPMPAEQLYAAIEEYERAERAESAHPAP